MAKFWSKKAPKNHGIQNSPTKPILIALIGIGGAERELFLKTLSDTPLMSSSSDGSTPLAARVTTGIVNGNQVWLIDSPSATVSDAELLGAFKIALGQKLNEGYTTPVHGVISLHDINETTTLENTAQKNLETMKTLLAPTLGANVMVVTAFCGELTSAVQADSAEAKLKAIYCASFPAVAVNQVGNTEEDATKNACLGMLQDLVSRVKSTQVIDQDEFVVGHGPRNTTPVWVAQVQSIIHDKDQELAALRKTLGILQDAFDAQSLELKKHADQEQDLRNTLQQAEKQLQEAEKQLQEAEEQIQEAKSQAQEAEKQAQEAEQQTEEAENQVQEAERKAKEAERKAKEAERKAREAEKQAQQLKTQMEQLNATCSDTASRLQQQFDSERRELDAQLRQSQTERADLKRQLDDLRRSQQQQKRSLNPRLNVLDARGEFPLFRAAAGGHFEDTRRLLEHGADASMRSRYQWTALHWAVGNGHSNVVQLLLSYGADVNAMSDTGRRPLSMAKTNEIRGMLLQKGAI